MGINVCTPTELDLKKRRGKFHMDGDSKMGQSQVKKQPPEIGLYISTKKPLGRRFVVEDVTFDDEDFFLVQLIDEASADDMSAMGDELDPDEWFALVDQYGLIKSES